MIKQIIFDLGGVLFELEENRTVDAFEALGADWQSKVGDYHEHSLFHQFETGRLPTERFRRELKTLLQLTHVDDDAIDAAWNAMLLKMKQEPLTLLKQLRRKYPLYLLSNSNPIHAREIPFLVKRAVNFNGLEALFNQTYYSHQIGYLKPHPAAFEAVLMENELNPLETLFIDDTKQHIDGAVRLGMKVFHVSRDQRWWESPRLTGLL